MARESQNDRNEDAKPPKFLPATMTGNGTGSEALRRSLTTATSKEKPVPSIATGRASGTTAAKKA